MIHQVGSLIDEAAAVAVDSLYGRFHSFLTYFLCDLLYPFDEKASADGRVAASRSMDAVNMPAGLIILNIDMVLMKVWYGVLSILPLETCIYVKSQSHGLRSPVATLSRNVRRRIL